MNLISQVFIYFIVLWLINPCLAFSDDESLSLTYDYCLERVQQNDPEVRMIQIDQQLQLLNIEDNFSHRRQTHLFQLQENLIHATVASNREQRLRNAKKEVLDLYNHLYISKKREGLAAKEMVYTQLVLENSLIKKELGLVNAGEVRQAQESHELSKLSAQEIQYATQQIRINLLLILQLPTDQDIMLQDNLESLIPSHTFAEDLNQLDSNHYLLNQLQLQTHYNQAYYQFIRDNASESENNIERARLNAEKATIAYMAKQQELRNQLLLLHANIQTKQATIENTEFRYTLAIQHFQDFQAKCREQLITTTELMHYELNMLKAELTHLSAIADFNLSVIEYQSLIE